MVFLHRYTGTLAVCATLATFLLASGTGPGRVTQQNAAKYLAGECSGLSALAPMGVGGPGGGGLKRMSPWLDNFCCVPCVLQPTPLMVCCYRPRPASPATCHACAARGLAVTCTRSYDMVSAPTASAVPLCAAAYPPDGLLFPPKACLTCNLPRPGRSKHCGVCGGCVKQHPSGLLC